jgi:hypothetical protein
MHSAFRTPHSAFELGPMERLALSWGNARQFTKLLLSLLSHIGVKMACRAEARTHARTVKPAYARGFGAAASLSLNASEGWWVATDSHRVLAG